MEKYFIYILIRGKYLYSDQKVHRRAEESSNKTKPQAREAEEGARQAGRHQHWLLQHHRHHHHHHNYDAIFHVSDGVTAEVPG